MIDIGPANPSQPNRSGITCFRSFIRGEAIRRLLDPLSIPYQWRGKSRKGQDEAYWTQTHYYRTATTYIEPAILNQTRSSPSSYYSSTASIPPTPSNMSLAPTTAPPLPAILCLHGGGSNSTVFRIQTRRLQWALGSHFRFVFAQAPIEGTPGMGMLPVFASCAPFYRWVSRRFRMGDGETEIPPPEEVEAIDRVLEDVISKEGGHEAFVGVIGFSQGARLAPGLILRQLVEVRDTGESKWGFKFGLVIGGPFPPICLVQGTEVEDYELLKQVPIVNAWGRDDPVRTGCKPMVSCSLSLKICVGLEPGHNPIPLCTGFCKNQVLRNKKLFPIPCLINHSQLRKSRDTLTGILSLRSAIGWERGVCSWILKGDIICR